MQKHFIFSNLPTHVIRAWCLPDRCWWLKNMLTGLRKRSGVGTCMPASICNPSSQLQLSSNYVYNASSSNERLHVSPQTWYGRHLRSSWCLWGWLHPSNENPVRDSLKPCFPVRKLTMGACDFDSCLFWVLGPRPFILCVSCFTPSAATFCFHCTLLGPMKRPGG